MNITLDQIGADIVRSVRSALAEDVGAGDITAELIPIDQYSRAVVITREACVLCGQAWFEEVFRQLGGLNKLEWQVKEGESVEANTQLVSLEGNTRRLLTGERSALNFLQLLSGTATQSRSYAQLVADTPIQILDTRKTLPGLRTAQKYAVAVGGCHNHRIGLYDAFLIKENHIAACGGITAAVGAAQSMHADKPIIVEVENLQELQEALSLPVTRIMLDNFDQASLAEVARMNPQIPLELSGNIEQTQLQTLAKLNISAISSGALTKHLRAIDLSLQILD